MKEYHKVIKDIVGKGWKLIKIDDFAYRATKGKVSRYFQICMMKGFVICPSGVSRWRIDGPKDYKIWELDSENAFSAFSERERNGKMAHTLHQERQIMFEKVLPDKFIL